MSKNDSNKVLMRYAGLATQFLVGIALMVFIGMKIDKWAGFSTPIAVWVLPLLLITGVIIKMIKDTSGKT